MQKNVCMKTVYEYVNPEYLDLMTEGDAATKKVILEMLLTELPSELAKMRALNDKEEWQTLWEVSHKMKSTLPFVGNEEMIDTNKQVEKLAKGRVQLNDIPIKLNKLEELCQKAIEELKEIHQTL